ncbi:hypothetical protein PVT71_29085 (plasmid) [Salipiger sp. H15]|uniref:RNase NYN domain-containing protein n=1 Tax=Alloyangia sp. H15 TaxID=3029062 RepID=A0AAU8AUB6_9RHOB
MFRENLQTAKEFLHLSTASHHDAGLRQGDGATVMASPKVAGSSLVPLLRTVFLSSLRWTASISRKMFLRVLFDFFRIPVAWFRKYPASIGAETSGLVVTGRIADANTARLPASQTPLEAASAQLPARLTASQGDEAAPRVGPVASGPVQAQPKAESPSLDASVVASKELASPPRAWRRDLAIVDGMDVMCWEDGAANLDSLRSVIDLLQERRVTPHIVLAPDACRTSLGGDGDLRAFRRLLGRDVNVDVCPSEKSVAAWVIELAGDLGAPIVSNDPYDAWPTARHIPRLQGYSVHGIVGLLEPMALPRA